MFSFAKIYIVAFFKQPLCCWFAIDNFQHTTNVKFFIDVSLRLSLHASLWQPVWSDLGIKSSPNNSEVAQKVAAFLETDVFHNIPKCH